MAEIPSPRESADREGASPPAFLPTEAARRRIESLTEKLRGEKSPATLLGRAAAYQDLGEFKKAEADANEAIGLSEDIAEAKAVRAECRLLTNRLEEAEADYAEALATHPEDEVELRIQVGYALLRHKQGRHIDAVRRLSDATMISRVKTADCYAALSAKWIQIYYEDPSGDLIETTRDTLHTPRDPRIYQQRIGASMWYHLDEKSLALLDATIAAQLDPNNPWPLVRRASYWDGYVSSSGDKEALAPYKEQAVLDYEDALVLRRTSRYLRQLKCGAWAGRYDRALHCAEELLVETPSQENLLVETAEWRTRLELPEKDCGAPSDQWPPPLVPEKPARAAFEAADAAARAKPGDARTLLARAEARCELGEYEEALGDCVQAIAIQCDLIKAHVLWGELGFLCLSEPHEKCVAAYAKAIDDNTAGKSDRVRALVGRAVLRYADYEGRIIESIDDLSAAAEIDATLAAGHYARLSGHTTAVFCRNWEIAELARDIRQAPLDVSGYFMRTEYCATGEFGYGALSLLDLTMAVHLAPKDPFTWSTRAWLWKQLAIDSEGELARRSWRRAARDWDKVIELRPQWRHARFARACALQESGDVQKARQEIAALLREAPNDRHLLNIKEELDKAPE